MADRSLTLFFRTIAAAIILCTAALISAPIATAQPAGLADNASTRPESSLEFASRRLIPFMKGKVPSESYLSDSFLKAVPAERLEALVKNYIDLFGQPISIVQTKELNKHSGFFRLEFDDAFALVQMTIDPKDGRIFGLFFSNFQKRDDSIEKIEADFASLPGVSGFQVARLLDRAPPKMMAGRNTDTQLAIASTFKLYILAEMAAQIDSGERKWTDILPLKYRSYSSLATRGWPKNSPVTLQTLALQMIAVSDNSATDTLMHALGRQRVERRLNSIGHSAPAKTLPLLTTVEAFVLKGSNELRERYLKSSEAQQRKFLNSKARKLGYNDVDSYVFSSPKPKYIDSIEWFASPNDTVNLLDHIRRTGNSRILEIFGTNVVAAESRRKSWRYLGYKGGNEPGVISMSFLAQSKGGTWFAITGTWNNTIAEVDEPRLSHLMIRLLDLYADK